MPAKMSFGQWLKQRRKTLDLTREALAEQIGCAVVTLYKIEADERRPSKQIAELLATHLRIPPNDHPAFVQFARNGTADTSAPFGTPFHPPHNLSLSPTPLIGRAADVVTISKRLQQPEVRLLTLIGPPGIGKTRLALQVASEMLDDYADGIFLIALAPISDARLVPATMTNTLGIQENGPQTPLERLKIFLHDKHTLLVLDNFEQILAAAPQIADLLLACPALNILVTSRAPLQIRQERQLLVSPLALPDLAQPTDVETLAQYAAVTLFLERAQAVKPDFVLTEANAPAVAAICARLDGLPLAIELISARVKLLSPQALLDKLHGRLMLQSDGMRDLEPRHRTLNAAIEWSFQLLNEEEQILFWRLGVFVGGWTVEAAEAVCSANLNLNILDGLASLFDKNLIKQVIAESDEPRFTLLETIREYALEQAANYGELDELRQCHADYFTDLAESTQTLFFRSNPPRWMQILETELDNFRAALAWSENGLRLAVALSDFWMRGGHRRDGSRWLAETLQRHELYFPAESLNNPEKLLRAKAHFWMGRLAVWQGDLDTPQAHYEASSAVFRELGAIYELGGSLADFGTLFHMRGDHQRAAGFIEEALALFHQLDHLNGMAWVTFLLGTLSHTQEHHQQASSLFEESLALFRKAQDLWGVPSVLTYLALTALHLGDYDQANDYITESLILYRDLGERWQIVHTIEVFAYIAAKQAQQGQDPQANLLRSARIFGATEGFRKMLVLDQQRIYHEIIAIPRAGLEDAVFTAAWAEGRAMTIDQAVAYALNVK